MIEVAAKPPVIVGVDGSKQAVKCCDMGQYRRVGPRHLLRPVFVIDAEIEDVDVELDDARSALDKARSAAENTDRHVEVDSEILHGDPAEAIAESAL